MNKRYFVMIFVLSFIGITSFYCLFSSNRARKVIYQGNQLMVSVDGVESSKIPTSGNYYLSNYDCNNKNTVVTWDREHYQIRVSNGNKKGAVSCYLEFDSYPRLSSMQSGSYVKYIGNNGCSSSKCSGENANYVDSEHQGYCGNANYQFSSSGWRIAYSKEGSAYLISAGALECGCTSQDGVFSNSCSNSVSVDNFSKHINNLDSVSLKYCNPYYVDDGICDSSNVRNINQDDFESIVNRGLSVGSCYQLQNKKCGYVNDLIDIGSDYWFSFGYHSLSNESLYWSSVSRSVDSSVSRFSYGVRPVIKLDSNVIVVGGSGSFDDPYEISNRTVLIDSIDDKENVLHLTMMGYGVKKMCVNVNSAVCTNYIDFNENYNIDINGLSGNNMIYVYYKDDNDNTIASIHREFTLDND